jgi:aspartate/methionine/tyrosine aminotransferase
VTKDRALHTRLAAFKDYTTICGSAPSEILGLIALRAAEQILSRHRARIQENLALLKDFFGRHRDLFQWVAPRGGTVCFPRLLGEESIQGLAERLVNQAGIMILPSGVYDYGDRHFRVGIGRQNLPDVLGRFEEALSWAIGRGTAARGGVPRGLDS